MKTDAEYERLKRKYNITKSLNEENRTKYYTLKNIVTEIVYSDKLEYEKVATIKKVLEDINDIEFQTL